MQSPVLDVVYTCLSEVMNTAAIVLLAEFHALIQTHDEQRRCQRIRLWSSRDQ